jgi:hypothetical protein
MVVEGGGIRISTNGTNGANLTNVFLGEEILAQGGGEPALRGVEGRGAAKKAALRGMDGERAAKIAAL